MKFVVDPRNHSKKHLLFPRLADCQGPALIAYNNAKFDKEDWKGIGRLDESTKEGKVMKVGRFGIGFQSVYHITGKPEVHSAKNIVGLINLPT